MTDAVGDREDLMSIGAFARRTRLPVSTLRYYDQEGHLAPAWTDPASGYRYYAPEQLRLACLIAELRGIGAPAETIAAAGRGEALADLLAGERQRIEGEVDERRAALATLARIETQLFPGAATLVDDEVRQARPVFAHRTELPGERPGPTIRRVLASLRRGLRARGGGEPVGYGAAFPLDVTDGPIVATVFLVVAGAVPDVTSFGESVELPAGRYLSTDAAGSVTIGDAYHTVLGRVADAGLVATDPVVEEYGGTVSAPVTRIACRVQS